MPSNDSSLQISSEEFARVNKFGAENPRRIWKNEPLGPIGVLGGPVKLPPARLLVGCPAQNAAQTLGGQNRVPDPKSPSLKIQERFN